MLVRFFTCCAIYMQIKFIFNIFILYGVSATAWQHASGIRRRRWRLLLAAASRPIQL